MFVLKNQSSQLHIAEWSKLPFKTQIFETVAQKYLSNDISISLFTNEKISTVTTPRNLHNDWLYAYPSKKKKDGTTEHLRTQLTFTTPQPFYGPFSRTTPGEPVPEENFWTLWREGRLTEADTLIIWLGATPSGLTSAHLHHPPYFLGAGCPSCRPTNSVKALKATSAFALGRRC